MKNKQNDDKPDDLKNIEESTSILGNGSERCSPYYCFKLPTHFRCNYPHPSNALVATDAVSVLKLIREKKHKSV